MNLKNSVKKNIALISTRPYEKNIILLKDLVDTNISLLNYPLTEIKPLKNYTEFDSIVSNLRKYQHVIFISTNAVNFFVERFKNLKIKLPGHIIYSSIGPSTQKALENQFNINVHCPKKIYDSKNLINNKIFNTLYSEKNGQNVKKIKLKDDLYLNEINEFNSINKKKYMEQLSNFNDTLKLCEKI